MTTLAKEMEKARGRLREHGHYSAFFVHRELSHHHSDYLSTGSKNALDKSLEFLWTLMQLCSALYAVECWWKCMHFQLLWFVENPNFEADVERMQPILNELFLRMKQKYDRLTNWFDHVADFSEDDVPELCHEDCGWELYDRIDENVYRQFKNVFELLKDAGEDVAYERALTVINAGILYNLGASREQFKNALLMASRPSSRPTIPVHVVPVSEGYFPPRCWRVMAFVRSRPRVPTRDEEEPDVIHYPYPDIGYEDAYEVDLSCHEQLDFRSSNDHNQGNNVEHEEDDDEDDDNDDDDDDDDDGLEAGSECSWATYPGLFAIDLQRLPFLWFLCRDLF